MNLLIAEDERINQLYLSHLLKRAGHYVVIASDGEAVLEALREHSFDAILMDIEMPKIDGAEATRRIRAGQSGMTSRSVPIIALSAHSAACDHEAFLAAGASDVLTKPVDEHDLLSRLDRIGDGVR